MNPVDPLQQTLLTLSGIGARTAARLEKLAIFTIRDLLFHLPYRYEDRTRIYPLGTISAGMNVLVCGEIELSDVLMRGRRSLVCRISDGTGFLTMRFFHFSAQQQMSFSNGTRITCFGEVREGYNGLEMIHPEYKVIRTDSDCVTKNTLTPVYPLTEGLRQSIVRKAVEQALALLKQHPSALQEWLPDALLAAMGFPRLIDALNTLHAPDEKIAVADLQTGTLPALKRLAFEELLAHHLRLQQAKRQHQTCQAPIFSTAKDLLGSFIATLTFTLTGAQRRVIQEISADCANNFPMIRLLQGDVGSGKTIVAAYTALLAIHSGYQVAVMAPTELLAEQHFRNFVGWFEGRQIKLAFLSGQIKGQARKILLENLAEGVTNIIIGTHALFQESVIFAKLGLVIIDEQHRFGVHQRLALREKGQHHGNKPHQLVMTATPIPRTLAMLNYSDLDISIIDELPPGRRPVITSVIPTQRRQEVIDRINGWIKLGRQAYWVCTLIEESEILQCEAAEKTRDLLSAALTDIRVALVHGRMKAAEKEASMQDFKQHRSDLLVATTVIEVGVDVPNAGLMIIENPERLGLSQLHQLRGRVGRGSNVSYCLLMYQSPLSDTARERLGILRETTDGFIIAEKDLLLRGPGEVLGTRQTGQMQFKIAELTRDSELIDKIPAAAALLQSSHPEAIAPLIQRWLADSTHFTEV